MTHSHSCVLTIVITLFRHVVPSSIVLESHARTIKYNAHCRNMQLTRANYYPSLGMDVHTWWHDLVEVRYTFTLDNTNHCNYITRVYNVDYFFSPPKDELSSRNTHLCTHCNCHIWWPWARGISAIIVEPVLKTEGNRPSIVHSNIRMSLVLQNVHIWPINYSSPPPKCALWWCINIASSGGSDVGDMQSILELSMKLRQPYWTKQFWTIEYPYQPIISHCTNATINIITHMAQTRWQVECTKTNYFECDRSAYKY